MTDNTEYKSVDLFARLPEQALDELFQSAGEIKIGKKETVFEPDSAPEELFVLKSGLIRIYRETADAEEFTLGYILPGQIFGESAIFTDHSRESFAVTAEESVIIIVPKPAFIDIMTRYPQLGIAVSRQLEGRYKDNEKRLEGMVFQNVKSRLAHSILRLSNQFGEEHGASITLNRNFTQHELATLIGASRPSVNLALTELAEAGLIRKAGDRIAIDEPEKLRHYTGSL